MKMASSPKVVLVAVVSLLSCCLAVYGASAFVPDATNSTHEGVFGGPWKAFISYRRAFSKHLAMLTKVLLARESISAFIDVDDLEGGHWEEQLLAAIEGSPNFIMILSNGTLDRCIGDSNYTDVLHKEIRTAVLSGRNIIPIFDEYTHPNADFSPEINELMTFQGVEWNHSMVNATIDRLINYLVDDIPVNSSATKTTH